MKKMFYLTCLLLTTFMISCSNHDTSSLIDGDYSVRAGLEIQSRTTLSGDATTVVWSEGDQIYLFGGQSNATLTIASGVGESTGTFRGGVNGFPSQLKTALYPIPTINAGVYSYLFNSEINYSENSNAPMLGELTNGFIAFNYLCPLVRIPLANLNPNQTNIVKLKMQGITGVAIVDLVAKKLDFSNTDRGDVVTVTIPEGLTECNIDIPVPAGTYPGYVVELNGEEVKSSSETKTLGVNDAIVIGDIVNDGDNGNDEGDDNDDETPVEYKAFNTEILGDENLEVDYAILGSNGIGYLYEFYETNPQLPKRLTIWDGNNDVEEQSSVNLEVNFNEEGLPTNIISSEFTIVLANHSGNTFDAFVSLTNGESTIYEDVELQDDMTWEQYIEELQASAGTRAASRSPLAIVNSWVGGIGCGISIVSTVVTAPTGIGAAIGWGLTVINCGSGFMTIANNVGWIDTSSYLGNWLGTTGFVGDCLTGDRVGCIAGGIGTVIGWADTWLDEREDDIQLGNGALISGNGDVKITLTWDNRSDIDLHCIDPSGCHIYYGNKVSPTGGFLDWDNVDGPPANYAPENIYFAAPAPEGQYDVYLHYYASDNGVYSVNYNVLIMINGVGRTYTGVISGVGTRVPIETFTIGSSESRSAVPFRAITWDWNNLPTKK